MQNSRTVFGHTGFPSPADDYIENQLDLNASLIRHPSATFFVKVESSINGEFVVSGDILIVDRSLPPHNNALVVAILDGSIVVAKIHKIEDAIVRISSIKSPRVINITKEMDFQIWGVVTSVIHKLVDY